MSDERRPSLIRYERRQELIRLEISNVSNHELREVLVGLWARLDPADRADHIRELTEYHRNPRAWLSPVAQSIKDAEQRAMLDIAKIKRQEREGEAVGG